MSCYVGHIKGHLASLLFRASCRLLPPLIKQRDRSGVLLHSLPTTLRQVIPKGSAHLGNRFQGMDKEPGHSDHTIVNMAHNDRVKACTDLHESLCVVEFQFLIDRSLIGFDIPIRFPTFPNNLNFPSMANKKGKGSGSYSVTSPTTATEILASMQKKGAAASPTLDDVSPSSDRKGSSSADAKQESSPSDDNRLHPLWHAVQTLPGALRKFLDHDYMSQKKSIKKLEFYLILFHFNPATTSRPTHLKASLVAEFEKDWLPLLKPFISPAPPTDMDTDEDDFDPLASSTTRRMLKEVIQRRAPHAHIASVAKIDGLRRLYKQYIDPDLQLPKSTEFTRKPRAVKEKALKGLTIEQLRFAIQARSPEVFIHTVGLTRPICLALYIKFVGEGAVEPDILIEGFHYSIIEDI
ncbi:uncharacterized protein MELLADRAFT_105101 [Melampsora larici-populina 98AG31]|uniref:Uncharacterized protein n=1 Tax=Melampsora larici-populina (strain 98AG31 / pathotype 3-4-7) TaxID=747676 RepID=F4RHE6_MELLP|nr:uncharacterized protein MELLADRAFT_105101 [Melampsora larici-populina 98AG31]EGG08155.1 hypothetical protein MELLADRAFT_105101 [Melampsora larici-populina 98AG31]